MATRALATQYAGLVDEDAEDVDYLVYVGACVDNGSIRGAKASEASSHGAIVIAVRPRTNGVPGPPLAFRDATYSTPVRRVAKLPGRKALSQFERRACSTLPSRRSIVFAPMEAGHERIIRCVGVGMSPRDFRLADFETMTVPGLVTNTKCIEQ